MRKTPRRPDTMVSGERSHSGLWGAQVARRIRCAAILIFCITAAWGSAQNRVSEYAVKAAYLFNFGKFVRFSPSGEAKQGQTFDICIVGEDPLGHTLDDLTANERLDDKPVRVARFKAAAEARSCAITYISAAEGTRVATDVAALRGQPTLTVSDAADFLEHGGMIQFVTNGNRVRFAVNLDAVRNAQLSLGSELLRVAESVHGEPSVGVRP